MSINQIRIKLKGKDANKSNEQESALYNTETFYKTPKQYY